MHFEPFSAFSSLLFYHLKPLFFVPPTPVLSHRPPFLCPRAPFFIVAPSEARGLPFSLFPTPGRRFLATLEKTGWGVDAVPNEVRKDAVPNEVRDVSLSLGRTG